MIGADIELTNVCKDYKDKHVVDNVNFKVGKGDFLTILGPSGAGKTTVLKMIAGFEDLSFGKILLNGSDISRKPTHKRNIGMLFQNYALFPHMTVADNIGFPLTIRKMPKDEISRKTKEILELVKLTGYESRYPREMSGGQQQRVALARALVFNPPVLLLDEPMAALDKQLRKQMQLEIKQLHEELGLTTISVTHDQEEALTMANKVCVMKDGQLVQMAPPETIYDHPNSVFVAKFIGEANVINARVTRVKDDSVFINVYQGVEVNLGCRIFWFSVGDCVPVVIRPEKIRVIDTEVFDGCVLEGTVEQVIYVGEALKLSVRLVNNELLNVKVFSNSATMLTGGDRVKLGIDPKDMVLLRN